MRFTTRSKAVGIILLVCAQYVLATTDDTSKCLGASCKPKVAAQQMSAPKKTCPKGYTLKNVDGGDVCARKVMLPCGQGYSLKDGKCCTVSPKEQCQPKVEEDCPVGMSSKQVCDKPHLEVGGRRLQSVSDITIKTQDTMFIPILPKPAISINLGADGGDAGKSGSANVNIQKPTLFPIKDLIPNVILPAAAVTINMPDKAKSDKGGNINIQGSLSSLIPGGNIVPVLPQPKLSIELPEKASLMPKINFAKEKTTTIVDMSRLGPEKTVNVNIPAADVAKAKAALKSWVVGPTVEAKSNGPAPTIDLSGMGPSKTVTVNLGEVKTLSKPNINIQLPDAEMKYLDLTGLSANKETVNVKLPNIDVDTRKVNIDLTGGSGNNGGNGNNGGSGDGKNGGNKVKEIVLPGKGGTKEVNVNVQGVELPSVEKKIIVEFNKKNTDPIIPKVAVSKEKTQVEVNLPSIDLTGGKDDKTQDINIVIQKPTSRLDNMLSSKMPVVDSKTTDSKAAMPDSIKIGKKQDDINIVLPNVKGAFDVSSLFPDGVSADKVPKIQKTTEEVTLPKINAVFPVPHGGNVAVAQVPIGGYLFVPNTTVDIAYTEKVTGGAEVLPNPALAAVKALGDKINAITAAACPEMCCSGDMDDVEMCVDQAYKWETVAPKMGCPSGCPANSNGSCVCEGGKVAPCPSGRVVCSLSGKDYCVDKAVGCSSWGAMCAKVTGWKSC